VALGKQRCDYELESIESGGTVVRARTRERSEGRRLRSLAIDQRRLPRKFKRFQDTQGPLRGCARPKLVGRTSKAAGKSRWERRSHTNWFWT